MSERSSVLYHFTQFKLIAPEAVKKCISINNEEKSGQTIFLDKYNSKDFANIINTTNILKASNCMEMKDNENLKNNLNLLVEKNKLLKKTHDKKLAAFNSRLNIK
uniref:Uncharacterized protein n=1 Tax=Sipha flava TaxID=143950 RepID=A0A2S2QKL5_9HEMI